MRTFFFTILSTIFLIAGCSKDYELEKSVFINDSQYPDLPEYSEWGYNTFGAYYDRQAFISNNNIVPVKCTVTDSLFSFILSGQLGSNSYYSNEDNSMSFKFQILGFLPEDYTQLIQLNSTTIDLKKPGNRVIITNSSVIDTVTIIEGSLKFKRAQILIVDTKQVEVILSGYFDFKILINNEPMTISNGRYDVGVGEDNFYLY
jgi:hypothetical protein